MRPEVDAERMVEVFRRDFEAKRREHDLVTEQLGTAFHRLRYWEQVAEARRVLAEVRP